MSFVLLSFFLSLGSDAHWQITETGIFRPLVQREVAVDQDGGIFIVNREEATIERFNPAGETGGSFGGKGRGPGEMMQPTWIHLEADKLYIEDGQTGLISVFSLEGKFLAQIKMPTRGLIFKKAPEGWLIGDWELDRAPDKPVFLYWSDETFSGFRPMAEWHRKAPNTSVTARVTPAGKTAVPYNPAPAKSLLGVGGQGRVAYFIKEGGAALELIDLVKKKVVKTVVIPAKPLRFNELWGAERLQESRLYLIPNNLKDKLELEADFPEYFPLVRRLDILSDGSAAVSLWTAKPDRQGRVLFFDAEGTAAQKNLSAEAVPRLLAVRGAAAYVTTYDSEAGEAGIARVDAARVNDFVAAHPIDFEGTSGDIVISGN